MSKSALPTLMIKGKLVSPNNDPAQQKILNEYIPYEYILEWFKARMSLSGVENRVLILKSETASGKSTLLPPKIYEAFIHGKGNVPGLICTQPRVLTAIENVSQMVANYSSFLRLGKTIGWSTQHNKFRPESFGLLSATVGTLTQQLKTMTDESIMKKYRFILIDETHERDLQIDLTICMLKSLLMRLRNNPNCPFVVLMSATFEPESFLRYFSNVGNASSVDGNVGSNVGTNVNSVSNVNSVGSNVNTPTNTTTFPVTAVNNFIWCRGEAAGFDEMWDWNQGRTVNNYPSAAAEIVEKICTEGRNEDPLRADILIFLPGKAEFEETARVLGIVNAKLAAAGIPVFSLLQIDGDAVKRNTRDNRYLNVPAGDHEVIINGTKHVPGRRLILTTVVAETGLTLNNLKYVIDAGYNRETEYNPTLGINALLTKPIPQSRMKQRRGRAGRKFRGVFYPLYPKYIYDKMQVQQFPQILTADITPIILDIIFEQLRAKMSAGDHDPTFDMNNIDLVDVPSPDALIAALGKLYAIGFITMHAGKWTGPTLDDARAMVDEDVASGDSSEGVYGRYVNMAAGNSTVSDSGTVSDNDSNMHADNSNNSGNIHTTGAQNKPVKPIRVGFTRMGAIAAVVASPTLTPEALRMFFASYSWGVDMTDIVTIIAYCNLDPQLSLASRSDEIVGGAAKKPPRPVVDWDKIYVHGMPLKNTHIRHMIVDEFIDGIILFNAIRNNCVGDDPLANLNRWCRQCNVSTEFVMNFIAERDSLIEHLLANEFSMRAGAKAPSGNGNNTGNVSTESGNNSGNNGSDVSVSSNSGNNNGTNNTKSNTGAKSSTKLVDLPAIELSDYITRIKHCIYDGYRNCTLVYDAAINKYISPQGVSVMPPKLLHSVGSNDSVSSNVTGGASKGASVSIKTNKGATTSVTTGVNASVSKMKPKYIVTTRLSTKYNRENDIYDVITGLVSVMDGFVAPDLDFTM